MLIKWIMETGRKPQTLPIDRPLRKITHRYHTIIYYVDINIFLNTEVILFVNL